MIINEIKATILKITLNRNDPAADQHNRKDFTT
jgi:hypothetical protein